MSDAGETPPSAASRSGSRRLANVFIVAFLAYHVAMPLTYYLGDRGYDERFSWRMFSTLRLQQCKVQIAETQAADTKFRDVSVKRDVQAAWVSLLERVRMPVVEKYLERRCELHDATQVRYTRRCTNTDGTPLPVQALLMDCAAGELRAQNEGGP